MIATGPKASGREANQEIFLGATTCLAVQMLFGQILAKETSPVGGFCPFNGFEMAKFELYSYSVGGGGSELVGPAGGFCEFLPEGGHLWGQPSFRLWGEA